MLLIGLSLQLVRDQGELNKKEGQDVFGTLLVQDPVIIPMLIIIGLLGGEKTKLE